MHSSLILNGKITHCPLITLPLNEFLQLFNSALQQSLLLLCLSHQIAISFRAEVMIYFSLFAPTTQLSMSYTSVYLVQWDVIWLTKIPQHCLHRLANWFTFFAQQSHLRSRLTPCSRRQSSLLNLPNGFHPFGFRFFYLFRVINFNGQATSLILFIILSLMFREYFKINT